MESFEPFSPADRKNSEQDRAESPASSANEESGGFISRFKERAFSYVRYFRLRRKEDDGKLSPEEFAELLSIDFEEELKDNPPFTERKHFEQLSIGDVFSPEEELAEIKKLPRTQKQEALTAFKEKLARQREAWASCRVFIERTIAFNPDTPREELFAVIDRFADRYGFTNEQRDTAENILNKYFACRKLALEARRRFPDNRELVEELSGIKVDPHTKLDVAVGPLSIDIFSDKKSALKMYEGHGGDAKFSLGGFATESKSRVLGPTYFTVTVRQFLVQKKEILVHEREHQKNRLLRAFFDQKMEPYEYDDLLYEYDTEEVPEIRRIALEAFLRSIRELALNSAKDEILAMKKDGESDYYQNFFQHKKEGNPYDYLRNVRNMRPNDLLWQETVKTILVEEYGKIISQALKAFDRLVGRGKYTLDEVVALFTDKPLERWPKTAQRLLKQKGKE